MVSPPFSLASLTCTIIGSSSIMGAGLSLDDPRAAEPGGYSPLGEFGAENGALVVVNRPRAPD
eukprot:scaffold140973_cov27-Tisochrysis_lutea.AAC.1